MLKKIDRNDIAFISGLILTSAGAGLIYLPLALLVPGVVLLFVGILGAMKA